MISVILLKPLYDYLLGTKLVKERKGLAVTLTMLSGFLIVIVALVFVVWLSINQLTKAVTAVSSQEVEAFVGPIREALASMSGSESASEEISSAIGSVANFLISVGLGLAQWLAEQVQALPILLVGISWLVIFIAIVSLLNGETTQAIIVLFGFYGVVNWIDIVLRPKFISEEAHINTALFLLSMFAGLAWAGIMGLFYGPIIMLLLVTTVQVYVETFAEEDGQAIGSAVSSITARRSNSEGADNGVTDVGEAAIPEEG